MGLKACEGLVQLVVLCFPRQTVKCYVSRSCHGTTGILVIAVALLQPSAPSVSMTGGRCLSVKFKRKKYGSQPQWVCKSCQSEVGVMSLKLPVACGIPKGHIWRPQSRVYPQHM